MTVNKKYLRYNGTSWVEHKFNAYDSEKLEGKRASDFALIDHNHDSRYLKLGGGILTGSLQTTGSIESTSFIGNLSGNATSATSAINASKLGGQEGSYYLNYNNLLNKPFIPSKFKIVATDNRTLKPSNLDAAGAEVSSYFTSKGSLDGGTQDSDYQDLLVLNTHSDSTGGKINALSFDKSEGKITHYLADKGANTWGLAKGILAYTHDIPTNNSQISNGRGYITAASLTPYATKTYVNTEIANIVGSAPGTLDTLNELAAALGDDPNFAATVAADIGDRVIKNADIAAGTGTKVTYDKKGLITSSSGLTINDIPTLTISKISNLSTELAGKLGTGDIAVWAKRSSLISSDVPNLAISQINNLQTTLDDKLGVSDIGAWAKKASLASSDVPNLDISKITGLSSALTNKQDSLGAGTGGQFLMYNTIGTTGPIWSTISKSTVGLSAVENKSSATIRGELTSANVTSALGYTPPTTNTTYSVGDGGLTEINFTTTLRNKLNTLNNYTLPAASQTVRGGVKMYTVGNTLYLYNT